MTGKDGRVVVILSTGGGCFLISMIYFPGVSNSNIIIFFFLHRGLISKAVSNNMKCGQAFFIVSKVFILL